MDNLEFAYGANKDDIDNPEIDSITLKDNVSMISSYTIYYWIIDIVFVSTIYEL